MQLFFVVGGAILLVLVLLLIFTSTKLIKEARTPTYLSAVLCFLVGAIALYLGFSG